VFICKFVLACERALVHELVFAHELNMLEFKVIIFFWRIYNFLWWNYGIVVVLLSMHFSMMEFLYNQIFALMLCYCHTCFWIIGWSKFIHFHVNRNLGFWMDFIVVFSHQIVISCDKHAIHLSHKNTHWLFIYLHECVNKIMISFCSTIDILRCDLTFSISWKPTSSHSMNKISVLINFWQQGINLMWFLPIFVSDGLLYLVSWFG
jgi:hypothetical protein